VLAGNGKLGGHPVNSGSVVIGSNPLHLSKWF